MGIGRDGQDLGFPNQESQLTDPAGLTPIVPGGEQVADLCSNNIIKVTANIISGLVWSFMHSENSGETFGNVTFIVEPLRALQ